MHVQWLVPFGVFIYSDVISLAISALVFIKFFDTQKLAILYFEEVVPFWNRHVQIA